MKSTLLLIVVSLLSVNSFAQTRRAPRTFAPQTAATRPNTQTLPIRRVILYSNGVAYIERRGMVSGHAEINLSFKQSQVDDVLKSMVVLDLGQGRIGAVSYNSSAPPAARLADIPFSIGASASRTPIKISPCFVNFMALSIRFINIWRSLTTSPTICVGTSWSMSYRSSTPE